MKRIIFLIVTFLAWTLLGVLSKIPFLLCHYDMMGFESVWSAIVDSILVMTHGIRLDMAIAGYISMVVGVLMIVHVWYAGKMWQWVYKGLMLVVSLLASLAYVSNIGLFGYWGFPLDDTALLYLRTSPADALASMTTSQIIFLPLLIALLTALIYYGAMEIKRKVIRSIAPYENLKSKIIQSVTLLCLSALLILPVRGGVGTGTNHTGSVYFTSNMRLNHAAVNPIFSFVEALNHKEDIAHRYRFMTDEEAQHLFADMQCVGLRQDTLRVKPGTNVVLVVLESFSKYIMDEKDHVKGVVPNLEKMCREGLYFSNIYANSTRTDRALVSILSGLPAQPSMSIMDMPNKSTRLPSIARTLGRNGYSTTYYYGGDANYSNMNSYILGTGFNTMVSDNDFPREQLTGKWGAADEFVYDRVLKDLKSDTGKTPFFKAIMTSSSHEPFDVPNYKKLSSESLNAFSYADYHLGRFIDEFRKLPSWKTTLVVIVPDHLGAYPEVVDNYGVWRYELPMVMIGGALPMRGSVSTIGSQVDIAATVFGLLGFDHSEFTFSKDLLDVNAPHFAFFSFPDAMGMVTDSTQVIYDNTSKSVSLSQGTNPTLTLNKSKAYLQMLYKSIDER